MGTVQRLATEKAGNLRSRCSEMPPSTCSRVFSEPLRKRLFTLASPTIFVHAQLLIHIAVVVFRRPFFCCPPRTRSCDSAFGFPKGFLEYARAVAKQNKQAIRSGSFQLVTAKDWCGDDEAGAAKAKTLTAGEVRSLIAFALPVIAICLRQRQ